MTPPVDFRSALRTPALVLGAALALAGATEALPPVQWPLRVMGPDLGLTSDVTRVMTADSRGFLWLGTEAGLFRFDGHRFVHFPGPDGTALLEIRSLQEDGQGRLWISTPRRLACLEGGKMLHVEAPCALPLEGLVRGPGGAICVSGRTAPLRRGDDGRFLPLPGWPGGEAVALASGADPAELLVARRTVAGGAEILITDARGAWRVLGEVPGAVAALLETRHGRVFVRTATALYQKGRDATRFEPLGPAFLPIELPSLHLDPLDGVWIPHAQGLLLHREGQPLRAIQAELRPLTSLRGFFLDPQLGLWFFSHALHRTPFLGTVGAYPGRELGGVMVWCFQRDVTGTMWIGTSKGAMLGRAGRWEAYAPTQGETIRGMVSAPDGRLWMAGSHGRLLAVDPRTGSHRVLDLEASHRVGRILRLHLDPSGSLWIGTERAGLLVLPLGADVAEETPFKGRVQDLAQDGHGRLLVATEQGLAVRDGATWRTYGPREGLPFPRIGYLHALRDGSVVLARAGGGGVYQVRLEPKAIVVHRHLVNELPSDRAFLLHEDHTGNLWIGTDRGLSRLAKEGGAHFNRADGLPGEDFCSQAVYEEPDGTLWFGTTLGALRLAPGAALHPQAPPALQFLSLRLGETPLSVDIERVTGGRHDRSLTAEFTALRYAGTDSLQYQARVRGLEQAWRDLPAPRLHIPFLPPGAYTLEVRARQHLGAWGPVLSLPLTLRGPWYDATAVRLVGGGAFLLLLWGLHRRSLAGRPRAVEPAAPVDPVAEPVAAPSPSLSPQVLEELRTPLRALQGFSQVLQHPGDFQALRAQRLVQVALGRMEQVLDEVHLLARLRSGGLQARLTPVQPRRLLEEAMARIGPRAQERNITLVHDTADTVPEWGFLDARLVGQLLVNLVGTVLRLTRQGPVRVRLDHSAAQGDLLIQVLDEGEGPEPARLAQALGPDGPGFGLAQELAALLGGQTGARSLAEHGCTLWVSLPLAAVDEAIADLLKGEVPEPEPLVHRLEGRILVADAGPANRALVECLASRLGLEVDAVGDAQGLRAALTLRSYQLALVDPALPGLEEAGQWEEVVARAEHAATPLLAFTAPRPETGSDPLARPVAPGAFQELLLRRLGHGTQLPDLDRLHLRQLEEVLGDREALLDYALELEQDTQRRLQELEQNLGDPVRVARLAHDLKTNTGNLGLRRVQAAAQALDEAAGEGNLIALSRLLAQLKEAWKNGWDAFRREVE